MKKAKRCLIAVVSGVLVATAVLSGCATVCVWHEPERNGWVVLVRQIPDWTGRAGQR